jgi:hypothetical protein
MSPMEWFLLMRTAQKTAQSIFNDYLVSKSDNWVQLNAIKAA